MTATAVPAPLESAPAPRVGGHAVRNANFELLKLVLSVSVLATHANALVETSPVASHFFINGLGRLSVPLFLMMNGFFLPRPTDAARRWSWLRRVLEMYAVWMLIYLPAYWRELVAGGIPGTLLVLLVGKWQLWYLPALAFAGFVALRARPEDARRWIGGVVALYLVGAALCYYGFYLQPRLPGWAYRNGLFLGLPFVILGLFFDRLDAHLHRHRYALLLLGGVILTLETWGSLHGPGWTQGFDMPFAILLLGPAVFEVTKSLPAWSTSFPLGKLAGAIYFVHQWCIMLVGRSGVPEGTRMAVLALGFSVLVSVPLILASRRVKFLL